MLQVSIYYLLSKLVDFTSILGIVWIFLQLFHILFVFFIHLIVQAATGARAVESCIAYKSIIAKYACKNL